ncbi:MAG: AAA family ATPase [Terrisporobacter sp.]
MKKIPIGISDFKKIESSYYFLGKSLLIKEFIENSEDVMLLPRPRRFGKTLNMTMMYLYRKAIYMDIMTKL